MSPLLQEIKSVDEGFPRAHFEDMGYRVETHGQKGFNGVAILSRLPLEDVTRGLPGDETDEQARWIEATVMGETMPPCAWRASTCPTATRRRGRNTTTNWPGWPGWRRMPGPCWRRKCRLVVAGDYNVIPQDEDAAKPEAWRADALALPQSRAAFRRILNLGFTEAIRARTQAHGLYSFWDYQAGAWERNNGIRIDHLLLSPQAADLLAGCRHRQRPCAAAKSPPITCRSGSIWRPERRPIGLLAKTCAPV
jgi:exodeoxyribonuclease III